jgi:predicted dehydrogenase
MAKRAAERPTRSKRRRKVRYAVVGMGYIAQAAVLPAFRHARRNSELAAIVSDDPAKREELSRKYGVERVYDYDHYAECLESGDVDAVYIALPNHMHRDFTVRAAQAGKHILCEKPLAVTESECEEMIEAAERYGVRLMTAYRLHFDRANLEAIEIVRSRELGEPRLFDSVFTMQVNDEENIRLGPTEKGGGPLYDVGIYCINAARYLFRAEPSEVFAWSASIGEPRFSRTPEMFSAILRFPVEQLAAFTCSFGAADSGWYQIGGTKGVLRLDPAYELAEPLKQQLTVDGKTTRKTYPKKDQFAPELLYFSDCVLKDQQPEPSGREGLADVRVIRALHESARTGRPVTLPEFERRHRPSLELADDEPPVKMPELVHAETPSGE